MKATSKVFIDVTDGERIYKEYSAIGKTVDKALEHLLIKIKKDVGARGTVTLEWDTTFVSIPRLSINVKLYKCRTRVGSNINWE